MFLAMGTICAVQQKAQAMLWFKFSMKLGMRPADDKSIRRWYKQFRETDTVQNRHSTGQPSRYDEDADRVR
jgi:hypothetical protein